MKKIRSVQWIGAMAAAFVLVLLFSSAALAADAETGVLVRSVAADGPAAKAGVVRGDILLALDGEPLDDGAGLIERMGNLEPGDVVTLTVLHGDEERSLEATLEESDGRAYLGILPDYGVQGGRWDEGWGRWGEEWGRGWMQPHLFGMMPYTDTATGAVVAEVIEGSPAEAAGLAVGDVILGVDGDKLAEAADLAERVAGHVPGDGIVLQVRRADGGEVEDVAVTLAANPEDDTLAYLGVRYMPTAMRMFLGRTDDGDEVVPTPPYDEYGRQPFGHRSFRMPPFANPHFRFAPPHQWMPDCDEHGMPPWGRNG